MGTDGELTHTEKDDAAEINERISEYQRTEDETIVTELLIHFESLVKMSARKLSYNRPELYEDLFQVGRISMLQSLKQFDEEMGVPFEAYAMKSLVGHMKNYLRDKSWYIQVPRRIKEKGAKIQKVIDDLTIKLNRSPAMREIAASMELSESETIEILAGRDCYQPISLDVPISNEDGAALRGDMIASGQDEYMKLDDRMLLEDAYEVLDPLERKVLYLVYNEGLSQRQIASQLHISQMSVSRTQKRAVMKLRKELSS